MDGVFSGLVGVFSGLVELDEELEFIWYRGGKRRVFFFALFVNIIPIS